MHTVKKILIDLEKLKNRYVGLGEVSSRFAKALEPHAKKLHEEGIDIYLLVPPSYKNHFGKDLHYITANFLNKKFPGLLPEFDLWHAIHQTSSNLPLIRKRKNFGTSTVLNFLIKKNGAKNEK